MGVVENVEVMGMSGADLETELLHHETPPAEGADTSTALPTSETDSESTSDAPEGDNTHGG